MAPICDDRDGLDLGAAGLRSWIGSQREVVEDTFDGGRTIAWEIVDQLVDHTGGDVPVSIDEMFVQVGGGALATSVRLGMASMVLRRLRCHVSTSPYTSQREGVAFAVYIGHTAPEMYQIRVPGVDEQHFCDNGV